MRFRHNKTKTLKQIARIYKIYLSKYIIVIESKIPLARGLNSPFSRPSEVRFCFPVFSWASDPRDYLFGTYAKRTCAYQGVRNISFLENFAHVVNVDLFAVHELKKSFQ